MKWYYIVLIVIILIIVAVTIYKNNKKNIITKLIKANGLDDTPQVRNSYSELSLSELKSKLAEACKNNPAC